MKGVQRIEKTLDSAWTLSKKFGHMVNKGVNGMPKKLDLRGYSSQGCVALRPAPNKGKYTAWYLECICGNEFIATTKRIRNGEVRSCGCLPPMKTKRAKRPKLK